MRIGSLMLLAVTALIFIASRTSAQVTGYYASQNTLPTAQGWTARGNFSLNPSPVVAGGALTLEHVSSNLEYQMYYRTDVPIDFNATKPLHFVTDIKVLSGNYVHYSDFWRADTMNYISDSLGHTYILGLANNGYILTSDQAGAHDALSTPFTTFDNSSAYHVYDLSITSAGASLYIDGNFATSIAQGATYADVADRVLWGNPGAGGHAITDTKYLYYGEIESTPEPGSAAIAAGLAIAIGGSAVRRRRTVRK